MNTSEAANVLKTKSIYRRQPQYKHRRTMRSEILSFLFANRAVNKAALEGYAKLLIKKGQMVKIFILSGEKDDIGKSERSKLR